MKALLLPLVLGLLAACSHPLEITGEGDIGSSTGANDCTLEQQPCRNQVTGEYAVTYTALPRPGSVFSGWEGCGAQFPDCALHVPAATVDRFWGQTLPPLRAVFTPSPNPPRISASVSWSATAATLTVDVAVENMTPGRVRLFPKGLTGDWVEADTSAPFSFVLDVGDLPPGEQAMLITAEDGSISSSARIPITVGGCNGNQALCSRRYDELRYATTHNAMSNAANAWNGPNQNWTVTDQLAAGVRALMLDTYRAGDISQFGTLQVPGVDPDTAYLCHVLCAIGKQPLVEGLREIREFLDANPGAVVTLILESYLSHALTANAFDASGLAAYAYTHPGGTWPTLGDMVDTGKRLVVLQDKTVNPAYPWLMNVWTHAFETHFSAATPADFSCADNRGTPANTLFIFNHFLTEVFGSPALAEQVNFNPLLVERIEECETRYARPANFITVDFVDIGDTLATIRALNHGGAAPVK
ncbi:MAG: hypothetical protein KDI09_00260 [Halioglobus sp.]|nr:hypothetical protein [Halioglobus sp.]